MVKVFVAQTRDADRELLCDFLKASGHDARPYKTDMSSLTRLTWDIMATTAPAVIVTSQRGVSNPYVSNMLHTVACNLPIKTLTLVYTRAAAQHDYLEEVGQFVADLMSLPNHKVVITPKRTETRRAGEYDVLKAHIDGFAELTK